MLAYFRLNYRIDNMANTFEPFDDTFRFDKTILNDAFPDYILTSIYDWLHETLSVRGLLYVSTLNDSLFILPLNRAMRRIFNSSWSSFWEEITASPELFRNILSYVLQTVAHKPQGEALEKILSQTSSAYAVEISSTKSSQNGLITQEIKMKLVHRVAPIVKKQATEIISTSNLLGEAWESHYGIKPDDEKTVTRATDALAGLLRDRYFPDESRPQLGKLIAKIRQNPEEYALPAKSLYNADAFLSLTKEFSKIRGNHKTGTGRAPSHEEAAFVLHFTIMLFQLLKR